MYVLFPLTLANTEARTSAREGQGAMRQAVSARYSIADLHRHSHAAGIFIVAVSRCRFNASLAQFGTASAWLDLAGSGRVGVMA